MRQPATLEVRDPLGSLRLGFIYVLSDDPRLEERVAHAVGKIGHPGGAHRLLDEILRFHLRGLSGTHRDFELGTNWNTDDAAVPECRRGLRS